MERRRRHTGGFSDQTERGRSRIQGGRSEMEKRGERDPHQLPPPTHVGRIWSRDAGAARRQTSQWTSAHASAFAALHDDLRRPSPGIPGEGDDEWRSYLISRGEY